MHTYYILPGELWKSFGLYLVACAILKTAPRRVWSMLYLTMNGLILSTLIIKGVQHICRLSYIYFAHFNYFLFLSILGFLSCMGLLIYAVIEPLFIQTLFYVLKNCKSKLDVRSELDYGAYSFIGLERIFFKCSDLCIIYSKRQSKIPTVHHAQILIQLLCFVRYPVKSESSVFYISKPEL